ncbi:MAG: hypothetical protein CMM61_09710 [Rhodospirillaceae bacterium]|nr:hypothetical protein [Rhodospirillaceae bacterium]|tara:strand:- start:448 stop:642 length:195 start_codon:yes stop_codon:yes gene_type:complete
MRRTIIKSFAALALMAGLAACASQEQEMQLHALETKVNTALQNAAAAKVDAATAMHIALEAEKK